MQNNIVAGCKKCGTILVEEWVSNPVGGDEYPVFTCPKCGELEIEDVEFNNPEYFTGEEE